MTALHITTFKFKNWFFIGHTCKQASKALDLLISFVLSPKCPTPKSGVIEFCYTQWIMNIIQTANKAFNSFLNKESPCVWTQWWRRLWSLATILSTHCKWFHLLFFALVQKTFQYFCVQRHLQTFPPFPDARLFTVWHVDPPWFQISGCADTGQGRKRAVLNFDLEPFLSSTRNSEATSRGRVARRSTSFKLE